MNIRAILLKMKTRQKIWNIARYYIVMIVACIFLLFIEEHVICFLEKCTQWLQPCTELWFVILFLGGCLAASWLIIVKIKAKKQLVAHSTMATALFIVLFYTYFRFINISFEFWGLGWFKWCDALFIPFLLLLLQMIVCGKKNDTDSKTPCFHIIDKPIETPEEDRLGYDWMSQSLLVDLMAVDVSKKSYSVGILGIWGQGKSSYMNLFKRHAEEMDAIVVEFYPRASKSVKTIQEDFFNALKLELRDYHTGINRYISNYAREVAEVGDGWIGKLALAFKSLSSDNEKERINSVIESINRKIFVMIEDLDRLTGEEILEVLKLLERNGDFCNTVYITAYDKSYVNEVIGKYLNHSRHQDYTDKYFDYEYLLPVNSHNTLSSYANHYLCDNIVLNKGDRINLSQLKDTWRENGNYIVTRLGTMRNVKRYLNIFMSRYPKVKNDVDVSDFMNLTLLRYTDLAAYNAVFELQFLRRGTLYSGGTPKLIYLQNDYEERLKQLHISNTSKDIIEKLFHKQKATSGVELKDVYGKLEWTDSFNSYFFDFRIGTYHYEDFQLLFSDDEEACFSKVKEMQASGITTQLTDFLKSRNEGWLVDENGLIRFIKIIIYLDSLERTLDLDFMIDGLQVTSTMDEYVNAGVVKDKESYKSIVRNTFVEMAEICPLEVGYSCHRLKAELYEGKATELVFTSEDMVGMSIWAQRFYNLKYDKGEYEIGAILNLAMVDERQDDGSIQVAEPAKRELLALMQQHPEQFAKDVVNPSLYTNNDGDLFLNLRFNEYFVYERLLDLNDFSFEEWISLLPNKKASYVIRRIVEKGKNSVLQVPALKKKYERGDFDGFFEAVKANDEKEDDILIIGALDKQLSLDYYTLCVLTRLDLGRVKESITRLVSNGTIDKKYLDLKDRMDPFEKGDYVKFTDGVYDAYTKSVYYSDNIFKITQIKMDGSLRLADIEGYVPIQDIEAIPVDGEHDRNLYYDPIIMAPYVSPGQPLPVLNSHSGEYYMDGLENTRMPDGNTIKSVVLQNNCQFVHEVQHCLRRKLQKDDLKLNISIKA